MSFVYRSCMDAYNFECDHRLHRLCALHTDANGNCMFESYYAKATAEGHELGVEEVEAANILRGVRPGNAELGARRIRKAIVNFLRENKEKALPVGVLSKQKRRVSMKGRWEDLFSCLREIDPLGMGKRSYDEHLDYMSVDGSWGTAFERVALSALGLRGRVLFGGDLRALKFVDPGDDTKGVIESEGLLWHHPYASETGVFTEETKPLKANHYDLLFSKRAVEYRKENMAKAHGSVREVPVVSYMEEATSEEKSSSSKSEEKESQASRQEIPRVQQPMFRWAPRVPFPSFLPPRDRKTS